MTVTAADLKARFEAFSSLADDRITPRITNAERRVDESWGDDRDEATMLLAAHYLVVEDAVNDGAFTLQNRPVTSEKLGDAQVNYAIAGGGSDPLNDTPYGRRYLELMELNFRGAYLA